MYLGLSQVLIALISDAFSRIALQDLTGLGVSKRHFGFAARSGPSKCSVDFEYSG